MTELTELLKKQDYNHKIYEQRTELEEKMFAALGRWDLEEFNRLSAECDKLQYIPF